jgi:hypothetical protein
MQNADNNQPRADEAPAPPKLVSALKRVRPAPPFIPPTLDEAILRVAQRHLRQPEPARLNWLRLMPWLAGATAIVLLAVFPPALKRMASSPVPGSRPVREDLNHDGRVDILDAFALARQLKARRTPSLQLDINGDGVVDERDVAAIASRAVRLEKPRDS